MFADWKKTLRILGKRLIGSPRAIMLLGVIILLSGLLFQITEFSNAFAPTIAGVVLILVIITLVVLLVQSLQLSPETDTDRLSEDQAGSPEVKSNKLTKGVKYYLDVIWYLFFALAVFLPLFGAVISIDYFDGRDGLWGVDLSVFWGFTIDLAQLTDMAANTEGLRHGVISGKSMMTIETLSVVAWYIFIAINEVMLLIALYSLKQARGIFSTLVKGRYFSLENATRLKKIGFAVIIGNIIIPVMQYFGGQAMLRDIKVNIPGIEIYPASVEGGIGIFIGLLILILAGVAREASHIYQDQLGTI